MGADAMRARIEQMANEIAQRWVTEGTPMRPSGTRDGDNDRCEMADDIWATLNENISVATEDEIWAILKEWHDNRDKATAQKWQAYACGTGYDAEDMWDIETIKDWAMDECIAAQETGEWADITDEMRIWAMDGVTIEDEE